MMSLETYVEHDPQRASDILNAWDHSYSVARQWPPELDSVLNLAFNYWDAIEQCKQLERLGSLEWLKGKLDAEIADAMADEAYKYRAFAEAYQTAEEKRRHKQ